MHLCIQTDIGKTSCSTQIGKFKKYICIGKLNATFLYELFKEHTNLYVINTLYSHTYMISMRLLVSCFLRVLT